MKIAFLTEMGFEGKIPVNHPNMRTEFAWMHALNADHFNIRTFDSQNKLSGYDHVFVIFPKGNVFLNSIGGKLTNGVNPVSNLLKKDIVSILRRTENKKIHYIQEGPHWLWNDYEVEDQIYFYNFLQDCDSIFAHNEYDKKYYKGLFSNKPINILKTLMVEDFIKTIIPKKENKSIIGGNFARWYGGFESYIVAKEFELPIWAQTSHCTREYENQLVNHLSRLIWNDWMVELSKYKYAVHLMPTVAAGTFSLNCAYFGIPCIGNINVDTQRICHPTLSIDVADINSARNLAIRLKKDVDFYNECSLSAKNNYNNFYSIEIWKKEIFDLL